MLVLAGLGALIYVGATATFDNTTRNEAGVIIEGGKLDVFEVRVGDCFNLPIDEGRPGIYSVLGLPCSQPHDNQVFAESDVASGRAFPGEDALYDEAWLECFEFFEDWVEGPYADSSLEIAALTISLQGWEEGERGVTCFVYDWSGEKLSIDTRASGL